MANEIVGQNCHVTAWIESTWGTKPGSTPYVFLPVEEYGVKLVPVRRNNRPYLGNFKRKHGKTVSVTPQGTIRGALHGMHDSDASMSLAKFITDLAFGADTSNDLISIGCELAAGPDIANKQHNGLRCDQMTLTASEQSGRWEYSANLIGQSEETVATAQTVPNDLEKLLDFEFADTTFSINSSAIAIASLQITRNNGLKSRTLNSRTPTMSKRTAATTTIQVQFIKNAATRDAYLRSMASGTETELDIDIVALGNHNGTSTNTNTRLTIDASRCQVSDVQDQMSLEDIFEQGLILDVLKPDSSTGDIVLTYDTV